MQVRNHPWWHYVLLLLAVLTAMFAAAVVATSYVERDDKDDIHILPGKRSKPSPAAFYNCDDLLDDEQFDGLRLVDTQSYGSSESLCHLAPADEKVADATPEAPVSGKRVVIRHADGRLEVSEHQFTGASGDPGDRGPVVEPR